MRIEEMRERDLKTEVELVQAEKGGRIRRKEAIRMDGRKKFQKKLTKKMEYMHVYKEMNKENIKYV